MNPTEAQARIKSRIWQAVAQADVDVSGIDKPTLNSLVDISVEAALLELDGLVDESWEAGLKTAVSPTPPADEAAEDDEQLLWQGRPFLSLVLHYTITDERIKITEGLLGKAREQIELIRIQDMDFNQTVGERLFNLGDITIRSHDPSKPIIELRNVRNPEKVHEILRRAVLEARKKHNFSYREEM